MKTKTLTTALAIGLAFTIAPRTSAASPAETKAIASDAYIYGYAMLYNYKTMFQQAVDRRFRDTSAASVASATTRAGSRRRMRTL